MVTRLQAEQAMGEMVSTREPYRPVWTALLGDGAGTVADPDNPDRVFVRVHGLQSSVALVFNKAVPTNRHGLPVLIGTTRELPHLVQVLGVDWGALPEWVGEIFLPEHGETHQLPDGVDPVYVQKRAIVPLRASPQATPDMTVYVSPDFYPYADGFQFFAGADSEDLTARVPGAQLGRFVLIYVDGATNSLGYVNGDTGVISPAPLAQPLVIPDPPGTCLPICAVRLYWGMTAINEADIYDLRIIVSPMPGSVGHDHSTALLGGMDLNPERISLRLVVCGPGLPNATLGAAVARVNALGPPAINSEWIIAVLGRTAETGNVTVPSYCHVQCGEGTVLDMGNDCLIMASDSSLENAVVTSTGNGWWETLEVDGDDVVLRNVRLITTGPENSCTYIHHSRLRAYHVTCQATDENSFGFFFEGATDALLWDCQADDPTNFYAALHLWANGGKPSSVTTMFGKYRGNVDDVSVFAGSTWSHFCTNFDPDNCTIDGAETPLPHGRSYFKGGIITRVVADDVSDPPTDEELDTAFGQPATLGEGFIGIVDDAGTQTKMWLCMTSAGAWWYEELTQAV